MTSTPNADGLWSQSPPTGEIRRPGTTVPFRGETCMPEQQFSSLTELIMQFYTVLRQAFRTVMFYLLLSY